MIYLFEICWVDFGDLRGGIDMWFQLSGREAAGEESVRERDASLIRPLSMLCATRVSLS